MSSYAHNGIGVKFYTVQHLVDTTVTNAAPIDNSPHVWTSEIITDTSWTTFSAEFVADSAYGYLAIGNFFDNANTLYVELLEQGAYCSYYFIDNVCISQDSLYCRGFSGAEPAVAEELSITQSGEWLKVNTAQQAFYRIYDMRGVTVQAGVITGGQTRLNQLASAVYVVECRTADRVARLKFHHLSP